jgi:hypothetical protein
VEFVEHNCLIWRGEKLRGWVFITDILVSMARILLHCYHTLGTF